MVVKGHDSFCRELPKPISNKQLPLVKMDTSLSRVGPTRWLKYPLQILENMVMQSAILLQVIFLMGKNLKILSHFFVIVMSLMLIALIFSWLKNQGMDLWVCWLIMESVQRMISCSLPINNYLPGSKTVLERGKILFSMWCMQTQLLNSKHRTLNTLKPLARKTFNDLIP